MIQVKIILNRLRLLYEAKQEVLNMSNNYKAPEIDMEAVDMDAEEG